MAELQDLERLTFEETEEGYALHLTTQGGQSLDVAVTPDQLDLIIDALNDMLEEDDELDEVDE